MPLSEYIDHTLLKADATKEQLKKLCEEAKTYHFKTVCVNPSNIAYCKALLQGSGVGVCTVVGFPLGQMTTAAKVYETEDAIKNGADEVDMVINIGKLKDRDLAYVTNEIAALKKACKDHCLKVIIETCLLTDEEKVLASQCVMEGHGDFVKTSTGFSTGGATFEDVALIKKTVGDHCLIKAAGGIKTHEDMLKMIELGANRIGTSSGVKLIQE